MSNLATQLLMHNDPASRIPLQHIIYKLESQGLFSFYKKMREIFFFLSIIMLLYTPKRSVSLIQEGYLNPIGQTEIWLGVAVQKADACREEF